MLFYAFALPGSSSAWLERCVRDAEVASSNLVSPIDLTSFRAQNLLSDQLFCRQKPWLHLFFVFRRNTNSQKWKIIFLQVLRLLNHYITFPIALYASLLQMIGRFHWNSWPTFASLLLYLLCIVGKQPLQAASAE